MPCGAASGRVVIDIDPRHGGAEALAEWEKANGELPYTLTADTGGGGCHFHYRYPEGVGRVPSGANVLGPGVDVRGDGGYVVAPPSPHASGRAYAWQDPEMHLETMPLALLEALRAKAPSGALTGAPDTRSVSEGGRNVTLTRLAGRLRRAGLEAEEILVALRMANDRACVPPLPDKEVATIAGSIGRREGDPLVDAAEQVPLVSVGADELCAMDLPPRAYILAPVFQEKNLAMIFAERGMGKTLIGVGWALAIATGGRFLRWSAPSPRRVLYIDGELPVETLQKRVKDVARSAGLRVPGNLRIITPDLQPGAGVMPNLATPEGRAPILAAIEAEAPEVVFLDNLSTLVRGGEENDAESWQEMQDFLVQLRSRRISVVMLHHTGKNGLQRGTSKREDVLDLVVQLVRPEGYDEDQGTRLKIEYTKARDPHGDAVRPFETWLKDDGQGGQAWETSTAGAVAAAERRSRLALALPIGEGSALSTYKVEDLAQVRHGVGLAILKDLEMDGLAHCREGGRGGGLVWWR